MLSWFKQEKTEKPLPEKRITPEPTNLNECKDYLSFYKAIADEQCRKTFHPDGFSTFLKGHQACVDASYDVHEMAAKCINLLARPK